MDTKLHNVRFYNFKPKAIHCMAFNNESKLLALSRSDHSIEIWNCKSKLFKQKQTIGCKVSSIEALVWFKSRLLSAGLDGFILEYNFETLDVIQKTSTTGGPIWCMSLSPDGKYLAAGTEKGFICLFTMTNEGLLYDRVLDRQQGRVLSIGWHSKSECLVTGSVDFIHLFSVTKGQMLQLPIVRATKNQETIVWCVALLDDMTIVTGDSRGKTSFFNSEFGTLIDDVSSHQADILSLQVSKDQKTVYVAGVDPAIVQIQLIRTSGSKGRNMWVKCRHRRIHTHDVRAMILTEQERLFSGGIDTYLIQSYYPPKVAIRYPATPPMGYFSVSKSRRILLGYNDRLELWRMGVYEDVKLSKFLPIKEDRVKLLEISLKSSEVLEFCSLSAKGDKIAYIVGGLVKLLSFGFNERGNTPFATKIQLRSKENSFSCNQVHWLSENRLVTRTNHGTLQVIEVEDDEAVCNEEMFELPENKVVALMSISGDYIACVDSQNDMHVIDAKATADSWSMVTLPKARAPITAIAIHSETSSVFRACSNLSLNEYDFKNKCFTKLDSKLRESNKLDYYKRHIPVQNISYFDTNLIYLQDSLYIYELNRNTLQNGAALTPVGRAKKQRKREQNTSNGKSSSEIFEEDSKVSNGLNSVNSSSNFFASYERVNHVMLTSCFSSSKKELVSIEYSPVLLLDSLPEPLKQKKYGTG